jgi:hypothetical protein
MAMSNQKNSAKLSQAMANLEQSKNRLQQIKAEIGSFKLTLGANMAVIDEISNQEDSRPIKLSTPIITPSAQEFTKEPVSHKSIILEYPIKPTSRYGYGKPPNYALYNILEKNRVVYKNTLESFLAFYCYFLNIPLISNDSMEPEWNNDYLPGLDAMALYSFLALKKPKKYFEAEGDKLNIVLPNAFISCDQELSDILDPIWNNPNIQGVRSTKGGSFWFEVN